MVNAVIVGAARTAIGTAYKGTLANTTPEELAATVVAETVRRSGLAPESFGDVILAESLYGGGDVARHAALESGMTGVPGQAVNRHCAGSLTATGNAAAAVMAGMETAVIAGGVQSSSLAPRLARRIPGTMDFEDGWMPPTHPDSAEAPNRDMSITVGWNTAKELGLSRQDMDEWALRSHQRAIAAIDAGRFNEEIVAIKAILADGSFTDFSVDEHPRRGTSLERLASLKSLHPEIEGFSISAGNSSGLNDGASAVAVASDELAKSEGLDQLATIRAWTALGIDPARTGYAAINVIPKLLGKVGLGIKEVALWEINEAFASVPLGACRELGIDDELVNINGSGCSIGHPVAASGGRMLNTLIRDLRRRGGGIGVAAMCAGGGQAGAMLIEVK